MKIAPLIAIIFAFFLIAIYPIYSDDGIDENLSYSDEDNDGIPNNKDKCPEEDASGKDIDAVSYTHLTLPTKRIV